MGASSRTSSFFKYLTLYPRNTLKSLIFFENSYTKKLGPGINRARLTDWPGLPGLACFGSCSELSRRAMLLEAIPAIYRAPLGGLERYLAVLPAVRALRVVHLSGATKAPAPVSVSVSHVLTLYFLTSPSRIMFAYCAPLRERHYSNHLPRWFVWRYINVLVSKGDPHILKRRGPCSQ